MLRLRLKPLSIVAIVIALTLSVPIWVIVSFVFTNATDVWAHLWDTVLADYVGNSLWLMFGVSIGVLLLGVSTAWLTSCCEFPLRRVLSLLLLMPMAMPAYIIAYTYTGLLDFAGPIQTWLRDITGLRYGQYWFPNIQSLTGAMFVMSVVLYPYVYLMARAAFLSQSSHLLEVSRSLGYSPLRAFIKVSLPIARPAIVAGLSLALMETLADYGTVQYFGVATFTTGIFRTYYGFGDVGAAAQLAVMLLGFVFLLVTLERYSRRKISYHSNVNHKTSNSLFHLSAGQASFAILVCVLPVLMGFVVPVLLLGYWSVGNAQWHDAGFLSIAWNSFSLASIAALIAVCLALIMAYAMRLQNNAFTNFAVRLTGFGYALPGTIIAIGAIIAFSWLDHRIVPIFEQAFSIDLGLLFSGSIFALLFAYSVRFLAVSLGAVQSGLGAIKPSLDSSARLLGRKPMQVLTEIHVPLLKGSVLTAFLIVFVDVLKELPGTLILRPFNFNTLAVRAYELAADERLFDAAPASLLIVLVGLVPVVLLNRSITKS